MSLGSFIRKQFIDVLQWTEDADGVLAWRYPMDGQEIQYGGRLTVRESQLAVFVNEGKIADVFPPGLYTLQTRTLPVLTDLKNWDKLFQSPFKSDLYFFSTRVQLGRRWGTAQPVTIRDREFGFVQVRAFGIYSYRIVDAATFYREISGTRAQYGVDDLEAQLRNLVVTTMSTTLGAADVPFVDMAANQTLLSQQIAAALAPVFTRYGLALDAFALESVSLPAELQKALDLRIGARMAGDLARAAQYQSAQAIPLAAQNPGGLAGAGAGFAVGAALGQTMAGQLAGAAGTALASALPAAGFAGAAGPAGSAATADSSSVDSAAVMGSAGFAGSASGAAVAAPASGASSASTSASSASAASAPPAAAPQTDYVQRLEQLKALLDRGLVTADEYARAKAGILARLTQ